MKSVEEQTKYVTGTQSDVSCYVQYHIVNGVCVCVCVCEWTLNVSVSEIWYLVLQYNSYYSSLVVWLGVG